MPKLLLTLFVLATLGVGLSALTPTPAFACAGLIGSNGAVNLGRTTTLAGYHDGVEHYVTAFQFLGGGGQFGTLIPLPAVPTKVERGGAWTLQRLARETEPLRLNASTPAGAPSAAEVVLQVRIDALDITVLKGGGPDVAVWAKDHGFRLSPDAPKSSTSTPPAAPSSSPPSSMATPPTPAARRSAMAPPSTSRSRRTTPGSRCASSASESSPRTASTRTSSSSPTTYPQSFRATAMGSPWSTTQARRVRSSTISARTPGWNGCRPRPG